MRIPAASRHRSGHGLQRFVPHRNLGTVCTLTLLSGERFMETRVPSALDDFLFDLNGYLILKNAAGPDLLARLNAAFDDFPPLEYGEWWGNAMRRDYNGATGYE